MGGPLEEELIRVVRTLEELQHKYLTLLEDDETAADPGQTLQDYQVLSNKMLDWIGECDTVTSIVRAVMRDAQERDFASHSGHVFRKLATNLCKKVVLSSDALRRSNSVRDSQDQEDAKFLERLEHLAGRKREMERRYKRIFKLHPNRLNSFLQAERDQAAGKIQNWWRKRRPVTIDLRKEEEERRWRAAVVVQAAARRWLEHRQNSPVWSLVTQARPITGDRARQLRREIEVWQQKHDVYCTDEKELEELYRTSQKKYNKFAASLPSRRMAEHRSKVVRAQISQQVEVLDSAPSLTDYQPSQWTLYHALPLHVATAARLQHTQRMERLAWPQWKRKIENIIQS